MNITLKPVFDALYEKATGQIPAALEQAAERQKNKGKRIIIQMLSICLFLLLSALLLTEYPPVKSLSLAWKFSIACILLGTLILVVQTMINKAWKTARDFDISAYQRYIRALGIFDKINFCSIESIDEVGFTEAIRQQIINAVAAIKSVPREEQVMDLDPGSFLNQTRERLRNLISIVVTLKLLGCENLDFKREAQVDRQEKVMAEAFFRKAFSEEGI